VDASGQWNGSDNSGMIRENNPLDATNIHQIKTVLWLLRLTSRFQSACMTADATIRVKAK
jgi:hypothetical protein